MSKSEPSMTAEERDKRAEECLWARHSDDWYIGNATSAEWLAAYRAVDEAEDAQMVDPDG